MRVSCGLLRCPRARELLRQRAARGIQAGPIDDGRAKVRVQPFGPRVVLAPLGLLRRQTSTAVLEIVERALSRGGIRACRTLLLFVPDTGFFGRSEQPAHDGGRRFAGDCHAELVCLRVGTGLPGFEPASVAELLLDHWQARGERNEVTVPSERFGRDLVGAGDLNHAVHESAQRAEHLGVPLPVIAGVRQPSGRLPALLIDSGELDLRGREARLERGQDERALEALLGLAESSYGLVVLPCPAMKLLDAALHVSQPGRGALVALLSTSQILA
ncbi:MAG TPA: hypothetical protein VNY33_07945 [Gaiellaceae bacterium]|nr:hypothetical protein [Gaiellaceae bacterium]